MFIRVFLVFLMITTGSAVSAPIGRSPADTVSGLYTQVLAADKTGSNVHLQPQRYLLPSFYALMQRVYARQAQCFKTSKRCLLIDWDVYDGAQVPLYAYSIETAKIKITGATATVPVKLTCWWDGHAGSKLVMVVELTKTAKGWLISDLLPPDSSSPSKTFSTRAAFQAALERSLHPPK